MEKLIQKILDKASEYCDVNKKRVYKAYEFGKHAHRFQKRSSGEPYFIHCLSVAYILSTYQADEDTIIAAILHDTVEDTDVTLEDIRVQFGKDVELLVDGVTKLSKEKFRDAKAQRKFQSMRKMFEIMSKDLRCILIKLCDRLHNASTFDALRKEKQERIAKETLDIFVPLAHKINFQELKDQLIIYCYEILYPESYKNFLSLQRKNMDIIRPVVDKIEKKIRRYKDDFSNIEIEIHPVTPLIDETVKYSIKDDLSFDETHSLRIITDDIADCYQVLFWLHKEYSAKPGSFKEYITSPRDNGYQGIHINIIDNDGQTYAVEIMTQEMAVRAKVGITAYWKGSKKSFSYANLQKLPIRLKWLEDLALYSQEKKSTPEQMNEFLKKDFLTERIFVFDRNGQIYDMPEGATVLDFLYSYNPDKAGFVSEIFVNKVSSPFGKKLIEGDIVDVNYADTLQTKVEWIDLVITFFAKKRIQYELVHAPTHGKVIIGKTLLQFELDKYNKGLIEDLSIGEQNRVIAYYKVDSLEKLLITIGEGKIKASDVYRQFFERSGVESSVPKGKSFKIGLSFSEQSSEQAKQDILLLSKNNNVHISKIFYFKNKKSNDVIKIEGSVEDEKNFSMYVEDLKNIQGFVDITFYKSLYAQLLVVGLWGGVLSMISFFSYFISLWAPNLFIANGLWNIFPVGILIFWFSIIFILLRSSRFYFDILKNNFVFIFFLSSISFLLVFGINTAYVFRGLESNITLMIGALLIMLLLAIFQTIQKSIDTQKFLIQSSKKMSTNQYKHNQREKVIGYLCRIFAITIFGISPIIMKYELAEVHGLTVVGMSLYIGLLFIIPLYVFSHVFVKKKKVKNLLSLKGCSRYFWLAVLFDVISWIFFIFSLSFTLASNAILFLNFAPVVGLIVAIFFFRNRIAYLRVKGHTLNIILIFIAGCLGSSLLIANDGGEIVATFQQKIQGDLLSILALLGDVIATLSIVYYAKSKNAFKGLDFTLRKIIILCVVFIPIVIPVIANMSFNFREWMALLYLGVFDVVLAYWLAYEAYKRMEGLIAYLMFNLTAVITIFLEVFGFGLQMNILFVLGAILVVSSTIFAEIINTKAEKEAAKIEVR